MNTQKVSEGLELSTVPDLLTKVNEKIAGLKTITESNYKTTGKLDGFGDIRTETQITNLIRAYSSVMGKEKAYNEAAADLNLSTYPVFEINGFDREAWKHDILLRKAIVEHKETLDKLNAYKEKLSKFLSTEDQKAILLKEMAVMFS
jgi:hypothetical protein